MTVDSGSTRPERPAELGRYVLWGLALAVGPTLCILFAFLTIVLASGDGGGFEIGIMMVGVVAVVVAAVAGSVAGLAGWIGAFALVSRTRSPWLRGLGAAAAIAALTAAFALLTDQFGALPTLSIITVLAVPAVCGWLASALHERRALRRTGAAPAAPVTVPDANSTEAR